MFKDEGSKFHIQLKDDEGNWFEFPVAVYMLVIPDIPDMSNTKIIKDFPANT